MKVIAATARKGGTGRTTPAGHPAVQATPAGRGDAPWKPSHPVRARVLLERSDRATNDASARRKTPAQVPAPEGPPHPSPLATPSLATPGLAAPGLATPRLATPGLAAPGLAAPVPAEAGAGAEAPVRFERLPSE